MNFYTVTSKMYDALDLTYFSSQENNPRSTINHLIPNENVRLLDMCCGTLANSLPIAKSKDKIKVLGIDTSRQMLQVARKKLIKEKLMNITLKQADATNTGLKSESFDFIVIGLALHEMSPTLKAEILAEAHRLLKAEGRLIVLEWEIPSTWAQKALYFPMLVAEQILCHSFIDFYGCDKKAFFEENGFHVCSMIHCNYTVVLELKKQL